MSLQSWQDEFYPVEADQPQTPLDAARHSLLKWQGVVKKNLKRHGLRRYGWEIHEEQWLQRGHTDVLVLDSDTCALCQISISCKSCALYHTLGKTCDDGNDSPYSQATDYGRVGPMIAALRKTVKRLEKESDK